MKPEGITLKDRKCIPCEEGGIPLSQEKIEEFLKEIRGWKLSEHEVVLGIEKNFQFINFKSALGFVNEIGDLAENEGHHPDMAIHDWNKLTIRLSTHSMKGLSENDFIMAAKIDQTLAETLELHSPL